MRTSFMDLDGPLLLCEYLFGVFTAPLYFWGPTNPLLVNIRSCLLICGALRRCLLRFPIRRRPRRHLFHSPFHASVDCAHNVKRHFSVIEKATKNDFNLSLYKFLHLNLANNIRNHSSFLKAAKNYICLSEDGTLRAVRISSSLLCSFLFPHRATLFLLSFFQISIHRHLDRLCAPKCRLVREFPA